VVNSVIEALKNIPPPPHINVFVKIPPPHVNVFVKVPHVKVF
jgi:hypothetical protein